MKKTAIILGSTGLTGRALLEILIEDPEFEQIKLFSRRPNEIRHPKVKEYLCDLLELEKVQDDFTGDVVFCCIGTTRAKTPDRIAYYKIDHGIPVTAAKLCRENKISTFIVISAIGANERSRFFYNRTKGEMQRDVLQQAISRTYILQPGLLVGERSEKRTGEAFAATLFRLLNPILPSKYRSIEAGDLAKAMWILSKMDSNEIVIDPNRIWNLLNLN